MNNNEEVINNNDVIKDQINELYDVSKAIIKDINTISMTDTEKLMLVYNEYESRINKVFGEISEDNIDHIAQKVSIKNINYLFSNLSKTYDLSKKIEQEKEYHVYTIAMTKFITDQYNKIQNNIKNN